MRLFVAIEAPDSWREAALVATEAIARTSGVPLRAVDPALMHLTLRFLGEVAEEQLAPVVTALEEAAPPIDVGLELGGAGTFGTPERTHTVWLGVAGDLDGLHAVASRVEGAVRAAGLPPENRPLRAHLTLARLGRQLGAAERRAVASAVRDLDVPRAARFRAREVVLVRSYLGGAQPRYEAVGRFG